MRRQAQGPHAVVRERPELRGDHGGSEGSTLITNPSRERERVWSDDLLIISIA